MPRAQPRARPSDQLLSPRLPHEEDPSRMSLRLPMHARGVAHGYPVLPHEVLERLPCRAVAAGALVASTLPDSPIVIDPDDSPSQPLPELPASLRASARLALDRVLQDGSDMAIGWVDSADAEQWRQEVRQILRALETPTDH
ncbi:DUF4259 domain-containing protein [Streptomyces rochei]|uniref:DUF4259 domain-containing protein n=1 Tax=Streptomyces rochei TaxID=1928 RepID=UPI0033B44335